MPYKKNDIGKRIAGIDGVREVAEQHRRAAGLAVRRPAAASGRARDLRQPVVLELRRDGQPADPHHRRERPRDAHRRGEQQRRADAGAVAGDRVRRVLGRVTSCGPTRRCGATEEQPRDRALEGQLRQAAQAGGIPTGASVSKAPPLLRRRSMSTGAASTWTHEVVAASLRALSDRQPDDPAEQQHGGGERAGEQPQRRVENRLPVHPHFDRDRAGRPADRSAAAPTPGCCRAAPRCRSLVSMSRAL